MVKTIGNPLSWSVDAVGALGDTVCLAHGLGNCPHEFHVAAAIAEPAGLVLDMSPQRGSVLLTAL